MQYWGRFRDDPVTNAIGQIRQELSHFNNKLPSGRDFSIDLGGSFKPADESVVQTWNTTDDPAGLFSKPCPMLKGDWIHLDTYHLTLFLDSLRNHTSIHSIGCRLKASGDFRIIIRAVSLNENRNLREKILRSNHGSIDSSSQSHHPADALNELEEEADFKDLEGPWISAKGIKQGQRLTASIECLSDVGFIKEFRWRGKGPSSLVNSGQRVYLLRTFGNSELVAETLTKLSTRVNGDPSLVDFASRSVFIVYDATGKDQSAQFSKAASILRILYTKGGNYGGGGNASFLAEIVRQAADGLNSVDEVIIIDDDAGIDPEVFIRHDNYISLRLADVFTSAVVFAKANPLCIQEWGGYWGRFFSELSDRPTRIQQSKNQLKFYPYLVRHGQNIKDANHLSNLAQSIGVDFSTFIFISFPFKALNEIGGILPVFLRNDDVDLSLRLQSIGYRLAINSNLFAYHDSGHSLTGEFFALFHALIVNSTYSGLNIENIQRFFAKRLASTMANRNLVLLKVYEQVLKAFLMGPSFMNPKTVYPRYKQQMRLVGQWQKTLLKQIPNEVIDELKSRDDIDIRVLLDPLAPAPTSSRGEVVFVDTSRNGYFSIDPDEADIQLPMTAQSFLESLAETSNRLGKLGQAWQEWVNNFNAQDFWGEEAEAYRVVDESIRSRHEIQMIGQELSSKNEPEEDDSFTINIVQTHCNWIKQRMQNNRQDFTSDQKAEKHYSDITTRALSANSQPLQIQAPSVTDLLNREAQKASDENGRAPQQRRSGFFSMLIPQGQTRERGKSKDVAAPKQQTTSGTEEEAELPFGFDEERYLRLNPDVRESNMSAKTHYQRYGRFEHRQY